MSSHSWISGFVVVFIALILISLVFFLWEKWVLKKQILKLDIPKNLIEKKFLRYSILVFFIGLLFYMDFIRDYVFYNLSYQMNYIDSITSSIHPAQYENPTDSWMQQLLDGFSAMQIYYIKFLATISFVFTYFFLAQIITKLAFPKYYLLQFTSIIYLGGLLMMGLVFSFYFFPWAYSYKINFYLISMEIGHFLESSLPTLLILASFKLYQQQKVSSESETTSS